MKEKYIIEFADGANKYTGEYGPCMFISGKTETSNPWFAAWFEGNGFNVKKVVEEPSKYALNTVDELKAIATEKGLDFKSTTKKDELIKLIEGAE